MGSNRVIRGGSWNNNARNVRAAARNWNSPGNRNDNLGFRLARAQRWAGRPAPDPTPAQPAAAKQRQTPPGAGVPLGQQELPRRLAGALFS